jgi:hypothetical protein
MAYGDLFHPAGTTRDVKVRGPIWAGAWSITGFYTIYWIYVTAKDLSEYGKAKGRDLGQNPGNTLLAVTLGLLIIVPALVAIYRMAKRVQQAQQLNGIQPYNGWLALVFYIVFSPIFVGFVQSELNKAWAAEGGPVPDQSFQPAPALPGAEPSTAAAPTIAPPEPVGSPKGDPLTDPLPPEQPAQEWQPPAGGDQPTDRPNP